MAGDWTGTDAYSIHVQSLPGERKISRRIATYGGLGLYPPLLDKPTFKHLMQHDCDGKSLQHPAGAVDPL